MRFLVISVSLPGFLTNAVALSKVLRDFLGHISEGGV